MATDNLFDKYLSIPGKPPREETPPPAGGGLPPYQAFDAKDRPECVELRLANGIHRAPTYTYLLDVISDGWQGTEISLLFSFMMVEIRGRNLQSVARSLVKRECAGLYEFNPERFTPPAPDAPVIERMEIVVKG